MKTQIKETAARVRSFIRDNITAHIVSAWEVSKTDLKERKRYMIILIASLLIIDYLMFCYHTEKNIFDIFPSFPPIVQTQNVKVYLPSLDGKSIITESREVPVFESDKKFAKYLFSIVVKGSNYENTSLTVPIDLFVRKIWLYTPKGSSKKFCVFDIEPSLMKDNIVVIKNSEKLFKDALIKTITENISSIQKVVLLEQGVPDKKLWEI